MYLRFPFRNPIRNRILRPGICTAGMVCLMMGSGIIGAQAAPPAPGEPVISAREIPNFHVVHPFLWRGAAPTPEGLRALKAQGVRTIIDLRISPKQVAAERRLVKAMGLRFINLPMGSDPPTRKEIETFLATTTSGAQQPVFVHCQHGADRSGTMIGIYREKIDGWDYDRTYKEMRRYGFDPRWRKLSATVRSLAPGSTPPSKEIRGQR